jgi:hypothetical protein
VTLSAPSPHAVTVRYGTLDGTATANNDYTPVNPTLISFDPYETSKTVSISVLGDTLSEAQEYFTVRLSGPGSATIADGWGQGTIVDNDPVPTVQLDANSFSASGGGLFLVTAHLSTPSGQTVTVHYATSDGTATTPADYTDTHGTLTFSPGQTSQTLSVPIVDDSGVEPDENLSLTLSSPFHADLAEPTAATLTLHDNDPQFNISPAGYIVGEGVGSVTIVVLLNASPTQEVTVHYQTTAWGGTATAGQDYTPVSDTLTFAPGVTRQTFTVPILQDTSDEPDEAFSVTLSNPSATTSMRRCETGSAACQEARH